MITDDDSVWGLFNSFKDDGLIPIQESDKDKDKEVHVVLEKMRCKDCGNQEIILEDGDYVCKCGAFVCRFIDMTAEWRYYGAEDSKGADPTRCGLPTSDLLPGTALGSVIGYSKNESYDVRIMRKYHLWNSMNYRERSLFGIFDTLTTNATSNGIAKNIIEEAKVLYKKLSEMKISRGDNRCGLIASCIYVACKNNKVPRSAKEIANMFNIKTTTMTKGCKKFQEIMKINTSSSTAEDFIYRCCSKLNIDKAKREICRDVAIRAEEHVISSENTPPSLAAGCIYLCDMLLEWNISKKDVADACEISQVTINKCYKKMHLFRAYLFSNEFIEKHGIV